MIERLNELTAGKGDGQVAGITKELLVKISGHGEFRGDPHEEGLEPLSIGRVNTRVASASTPSP